MDRFLKDSPAGLDEGHCTDDALAHLRFKDGGFDLALCSYLLFLYSDTLYLEFRAAREARVFPLLGDYGEPSPHLVPAIQHPRGLGCGVERRRVPLEFLRGLDEMLTVSGLWPRHDASSMPRRCAPNRAQTRKTPGGIDGPFRTLGPARCRGGGRVSPSRGPSVPAGRSELRYLGVHPLRPVEAGHAHAIVAVLDEVVPVQTEEGNRR